MWLAEQCNLLERRNLDLRKELRASLDRCAHLESSTEKYKAIADDLEQQIMRLTVRASGTSKAEEKLKQEIAELKKRIHELEQDKLRVAKERATESKILDRVCEKHSLLAVEIQNESTRHAEREEKYNAMLSDYKAVTEKETRTLKTELQQRRKQVQELQTSLHAVEKELARVKQVMLETAEELSDAHEQAQTMILEKEMLQKQLDEVLAAYRRDIGEAKAQAAGFEALQARCLETQGLLRQSEIEIQDLKRQVAETLSREGTLVGKIFVARHSAMEATTAKVKAERLSQQQHMA